MKLAVDHLPLSARRIAEVVGVPATLALVLAFPGKTIWPAKNGADRARLAEVMGEAAADKLVRAFREPLWIPRCVEAIRGAVQADIRAEFDRRTRAGESARSVVSDLAGRPPLAYTDRHVWRVLKGADAGGEVVDTSQADLF